jgi:hypothetical protein
MARDPARQRCVEEWRTLRATLALPVLAVGLPVALLLGALFGERVYGENKPSLVPFALRCGLCAIGLGLAAVAVCVGLAAYFGWQ